MLPYGNANDLMKVGAVHGTRYIASQVCSIDLCIGLLLFIMISVGGGPIMGEPYL